MLIKIRTLTPIWTGDVNGKCTKLRETTIIGSLRWWFEAIVRGLGGYACDSVGEVVEKCVLDVEKYKKGRRAEELVCPVCYVFGTTNWARRFRIEAEPKEQQQVPCVNVKTRRSKGHMGWYLGKKVKGNSMSAKYGGLYGCYDINIHEFASIKDCVCLALNVATLWGVGAKTQDGFGICSFSGEYDVANAVQEIKNIIEIYQSVEKNRTKKNELLFPDLRNFFFVKVKVKANFDSISREVFSENIRLSNEHPTEKLLKIYEKLGFYPTAPLIRDWLRGLFRNGNDDLRHFLFGFIAKNVHKSCEGELIKDKRSKKLKCIKCGKYVSRNEIKRSPTLTINGKIHEKMASKIFVSHVYKLSSNWEFKIWGYVPEILPNNVKREEVLEKLFTKIKKEKSFADKLKLNKNQIEVEWYEISTNRSTKTIVSVEDLINAILEVRSK